MSRLWPSSETRAPTPTPARSPPCFQTMPTLQARPGPGCVGAGRAWSSLDNAGALAVAFIAISPTIPSPSSLPSLPQRSCGASLPFRSSFITPHVERRTLQRQQRSTSFSCKPSYARPSRGIFISACSSEKNGEANTGSRRHQEPLQARPGLVGAVPLWIFLSLASRIQSAVNAPQKSTDTLPPPSESDRTRDSSQTHTLTDAPEGTDRSDESRPMEFTDRPATVPVEEKSASNGYRADPKSDETDSKPPDASNNQVAALVSTVDNDDDDDDETTEQNNAYLKQLQEEYHLAMDALSGRIRVLEDALESTEEQAAEWRVAADRATQEARATADRLESDAKRGADASAACARALYKALTRAQTQHAAAVKARGEATATDSDFEIRNSASGLSSVDVKSATSRAMFDAMMSAQTRATAARLYAANAREEHLRLRRSTLDGYKVAMVITALAFTVMGLILSTPSVLEPLLPTMFPSVAYQR